MSAEIISITLNGEEEKLDSGMSLQDLIQHKDLSGKRIAVELNQEIIAKSAYASTRLNNNDVLEIVNAIGGG